MTDNNSSKIAKNTAYLTFAFVGQKILSFIYFTLIARFAGVEDTGKYFFALSFTTVFSIFIDLGLAPVLIREGSKFKEKINTYLNNILGIKSILSGITFLAVIIVINLLGYPPITKNLVYLAAIIMVLDSFHLSFYNTFRAHQNLKYEALGVVIGQFLTLTAGGAALIFGWPLYFLILAVMINSLFNFFFSFYLAVKKLGLRIRPTLDRGIIKTLFKIALPFAVAGIFVKVNFFDSVLLSILTEDKYVGWYSVPFKITFALQFIPMAFAASIFPAMSKLYLTSRESLASVFQKAMMYLAVIAIPAAVGIAVLADQIIISVYGVDYTPSVLPLRILIFSLVPIFLNFPVGSLLNACDKQVTNTINMGISTVLNIILNIFLILKYNIVGAAMTALISHTLLFILGLYWTPKIAPYNKKELLFFVFKILLAGFIMGAVIFYLKNYFSFITLIPLGAIIFFIAVYLLRALNKEDFVKISKSVFNK